MCIRDRIHVAASGKQRVSRNESQELVVEWHDMKEDIRADLLARGLKEPRLRLAALDSLERLLSGAWPGFLTNPAVLKSIGKQAVSKEVALLKKTGKLNDAEESVLNEIFERLA